jgi:phenylacetaldehyde dehydrogenase
MSIADKFDTMEYGPALEDSKDAIAWLDLHKRRFAHFINGAWSEPTAAAYFDTADPSTGEKLASVAQGSPNDVDAAVKAARTALPRWQALTPHARARYLYALARQVQKHSRRLAVLETMDNGKPIRESRDIDIPLVARHFYHHAGWAQLLDQEFPGLAACGVVGQIIPWNFPLLMAAWKLAPALATGCTIVLKVAEETPLSALRLGEIVQEAGVPPGVVNIVTGFGATAGAALAAHPGVDKVAFTGSTEVGKLIVQAAARDLKHLSLELGGKSPVVVLKDADLDVAIPGAASAIFFNHGQCCCAGSRLYVQKSIFDQVVEGVAAYAKAIKLGPGLDPTTEMGPMVSETQRNRVCGYLEAGKQEGARAIAGGKAREGSGYFVEPTVFVDTRPNMKIVREEIFGPVVTAMPFTEMDEDLVREANDSIYGLAAGIWTRDLSKAHALAAQLKAGSVWVNCYNIFDAALPFGGYKQSGWGREMGEAVLDSYLNTKAVTVRL